MMEWKPFTYQGKTYPLDHLHPFELIVSQPAVNTKPERTYFIDVIFSLHCFSRKKLEEENVEAKLLYRDTREARIFCFERYEQSKKLSRIISNIRDRKCYHTKHNSYFTIEMVNTSGEIEDYEVYFIVSKSSKKNRLNLFVQSAYIRKKDHKISKKKKKPIRFDIIAYNTATNKPIKSPS